MNSAELLDSKVRAINVVKKSERSDRSKERVTELKDAAQAKRDRKNKLRLSKIA